MENPMVNYAKIIKQTNSEMFNVRDEYKNNTVEQNQFICHLNRRKFSVGCINITGELNIGMMIRSACLFGAENFYIFGRKKFDKRSTVGAENYINIIQYTYDDPLKADEQMTKDITHLNTIHTVYVCEQDGRHLGINKRDWTSTHTTKEEMEQTNPLFLFGSESHGVPKSIIDIVPPIARISIPQVGVLRSFNVSAAMNIIVWDYIKEVYL